MLNKLDKETMVYSKKVVRVNVGDTVFWKATDKGHNVEFIKGGVPEGVEKFKSKSSFKRILKINQDIRVDVSSNLNLDESYALYESYINHRHLDGDMFPATEKQFSAFILENTDDTIFFKFFDKEKLIAVSVADILHDGLSAVYCFYDPIDKRRSLGTYAILYQIHRVLEQERLYLYLGYWIKNCRKMLYKTRFRPLEMLVNNKWVEVN